MCGIIGIVGRKNLSKKLFEALKRLEYRGYDSVGMAVASDGKIAIKKDVGTIKQVNEKVDFSSLHGELGVAHCRWGTHGGITKENAHPHCSCDGKIAVVHNGIVENYQEIREMLKSKKHKFISQTDTEVIPHLIEQNMNEGLSFVEAFKFSINQLKGRFAIVTIHSDEKIMLAARRGSPLVLGIGDDETFVSSDITAFLEYTNKVIFLDDNELVVIDDGIAVTNLITNKEVHKSVEKIDWKISEASKNGYEHYMLKEVLEQRFTIQKAVEPNIDKIREVAEMIKNAKGTFFIGCGTAGKVGSVGTYLFSRIAEKHVNFSIGSEFPQYHHFIKPETLVIAISQSGETADTLEAIEAAKKKGAKIVSIVNVVGSTMTRLSDNCILINSGPEKCVASTKVTTAQIAVMALLAYAVAGKLKEGVDLIHTTSDFIAGMLNEDFLAHVKSVADKIKDNESLYIIGRGLNYPMALEAAIKMQEVPYIHAEGFAGGELKHGPLALITEGTPLIVLVANDETKHDVLSNAMEIKSRGGMIIGISPDDNEIFDYHIRVPDVGNASPIANIIPVQLLAYYCAILKGQNPDYLRNLAKSVTVK